MNRDKLIDEVKYLRQDVADLKEQLQKADQDKERLVECLKEIYNAKYPKYDEIMECLTNCGITA
jgi:predicted nuclease with TOPRIM domain